MSNLTNTQLFADLESGDYLTRWFAAEVIGTRRGLDGDQMTKLIDLIGESDVSEVICWGLGQMKCEAAVPIIKTLLSHPNMYYQWRAAESLRDIGSLTAIAALTDELQHNVSPETRWRCAWALGEIGDIIACDVLWDVAMSDRDAYVRWRSIWGLSKLEGDVEGFVRFKLENTDDEFSQWRGIWLIGQVGRESSIQWLDNYVTTEVKSQYVEYQYSIAKAKLEVKD